MAQICKSILTVAWLCTPMVANADYVYDFTGTCNACGVPLTATLTLSNAYVPGSSFADYGANPQGIFLSFSDIGGSPFFQGETLTESAINSISVGRNAINPGVTLPSVVGTSTAADVIITVTGPVNAFLSTGYGDGTNPSIGWAGTTVSGGNENIQYSWTLVSEPAPVPLPASGWLLLSGLGGLTIFRRRITLRRHYWGRAMSL